MTLRISRQSDYYPTNDTVARADKTEATRKRARLSAREHRTPSHLVNGSGIGRLGTDPRES